MHVVVYMATTHMSDPFYPRCANYGKLKQILDVNNHLRILRHLNQPCPQILSLSKDLLLLNPTEVKYPTSPNLLISVTTKS